MASVVEELQWLIDNGGWFLLGGTFCLGPAELG